MSTLLRDLAIPHCKADCYMVAVAAEHVLVMLTVICMDHHQQCVVACVKV